MFTQEAPDEASAETPEWSVALALGDSRTRPSALHKKDVNTHMVPDDRRSRAKQSFNRIIPLKEPTYVVGQSLYSVSQLCLLLAIRRAEVCGTPSCHATLAW